MWNNHLKRTFILAFCSLGVLCKGLESEAALIESISWKDLSEKHEKSNLKLKKAFSQGIFYFEMPFDNYSILDKMFEYTIRQYEIENWSGFYESIPDGDQVRTFVLCSEFWQTHLPSEIKDICETMLSISNAILNKGLSLTDIPEELWKKGPVVLQKTKRFNFSRY